MFIAAYLSNVCPFVAQTLVRIDEQLLLCIRPGVTLDVWPQLVVPPLTALFANASWEAACYHAPLALPKVPHQAAGHKVYTMSMYS